MNHKLAIQFVVFLMLALWATHRLGLLHDSERSQKQRQATQELYRQMDELDHLRRSETIIYSGLERARGSLAGISTAFLPDPADVYAWTTLQVRHLARQAGIEIQHIEPTEGPRLRSQRGEDTRQFFVHRCEVEFIGTQDQVLDFVRIAEKRNPYLVVSGLTLGPERESEGERIGSITLDWPAWRTLELREELLAEIDLLDHPTAP